MTKRVQNSADPDTETFTPAVTFDGYPDGKTKVTFRAGVESIPVPAEFARLMREKGHVAPPSVTNLDGSPMKREADGTVAGEALKLTDAERAASPPLAPVANKRKP